MDAGGTLKSSIVQPQAVAAHTFGVLRAMPWGTKQGFNRPKTVRERHKMVVMLNAAGWTNKDIARAMGYTEGRVSIIVRSTHPELEAVRKNAAQKVMDNTTDLMLRFRAESNKSLDTIIEIRDASDAPKALRRLAARDILDRAGYSPIRKQLNMELQVPSEALVEAANRLGGAEEVQQRKNEWVVQNPDGSVAK